MAPWRHGFWRHGFWRHGAMDAIHQKKRHRPCSIGGRRQELSGKTKDNKMYLQSCHLALTRTNNVSIREERWRLNRSRGVFSSSLKFLISRIQSFICSGAPAQQARERLRNANKFAWNTSKADDCSESYNKVKMLYLEEHCVLESAERTLFGRFVVTWTQMCPRSSGILEEPSMNIPLRYYRGTARFIAHDRSWE